MSIPKVTLGCTGLVAIGAFSYLIARGSGSPSIAWIIGYFTAVMVTYADRRLFSRPPSDPEMV